ncbi:MAG: response regulator [Chloroflexi bacterium]|nr:response regulator [Chloroflexota bacterium]MBP7043264.1 response regulator [Chloroflexota bacterium]
MAIPLHNFTATRILVVDDEPEIAESLADFLVRKEGFLVSLASTGEEAIDYLKSTIGESNEVDLVLLDMRMPGMSGLEVLAWIRQHPVLRYTRVVLLTAAAGSNDKVEALSAGADDYITKPYYPQELLARVKTILRTQQLEKQLQRQSQQLASLNQMGQRLATTLETQEVFATAVSGAIEILGVESAAAFLLEGGRLRCKALRTADGLVATDHWLDVDEGFVGQVFARQTPTLLNDPANDGRFQPAIDIPPGIEPRNMMAAPLVVRSRPVGVLTCYNRENGRFSDNDLELFSSLAISISDSIENAWLFQRIRMRQQELLENRNTLQALIDGIPHPIYTINDNWKLISINKSKANEHPETAEQLVGRPCYQAFYHQKAPCAHCQVTLTLENKQAQHWSVSWQGEDHLPRNWDVSAYPIPSSQAASVRAVILWQDRTEERRLESSLLQAGKLAAIGQLAAGVAHEINNPLTAINANAEMLKMFIPPEDDNYEAVDLIARAGERATKVVRGLLDFARQEQYKFTSSDVNLSIHQTLDLISYQFHTAGITIVDKTEPALPSITASWEHLKSVWLNLLVNARDAVQSVSENRQIEITTRLTPERDHVQVLFRDNGHGMSAAEAQHIFEPFYTTKEPGKGTGLGLATSHRIIEQHGGDIHVVSAPNQGTTFIIRLPVQPKFGNGRQSIEP